MLRDCPNPARGRIALLCDEAADWSTDDAEALLAGGIPPCMGEHFEDDAILEHCLSVLRADVELDTEEHASEST